VRPLYSIADSKALGIIMADHTAIDWRPLLPRISMPCLNLGGAVRGNAACSYRPLAWLSELAQGMQHLL
jgi:hypothetical protein